MNIANPYLNRTAIKDDRGFFGRRRELTTIFSRVDATEPQSVSIVGERRIGKSSLLRAVMRRQQLHLRRPDEFVFVYLDLHETVYGDVSNFFSSLLEQLSFSLRDPLIQKHLPTYENIRTEVTRLDRARLKLVLLLDEFEAVTQNARFSLEFFSFLRSLPNNYSVAFIVSSARELQELCHSKELAGSPFFNIFHKLNLGAFTPDEAAELITVPSADAGYPLQPYAAEIIRLGGYFPFFLQMACCIFFENHVNSDQVRLRFHEQAIGHFVYVWDHLNERERTACIKLSQDRELNEADRSFVGSLIRRGYAYQNGREIKLFSDSFDDFVKARSTIATQPIEAEIESMARTVPQEFPRTVSGRFLIREILGSGGMGEVYLARDTKLKRFVAMKRIARHLRDQPEYRRRLLNEAGRASQLNHPCIVGVYDLIDAEGDVFLVMEYVKGQSLRTRVAGVRLDELLKIARQCADALAAAHQKGIVHCDIKPENILITPEGDVKILDFGVAKSIPQLDGETITRDQTVTKVVSGTLQYMAPEILLERAPDTRSDIFSFGIVLYELWSGTHPFRSSTAIETANRIMNWQPSSLENVIPGTPAALAQVISRCLDKNPADRYPDALTLLSDLNKIELARAHSGQ